MPDDIGIPPPGQNLVEANRLPNADWYRTLAQALSRLNELSRLETQEDGPVAVADLPDPADAGEGARAFVTNATATTFASIVAGGGANNVPVYSDGTNWRIG